MKTMDLFDMIEDQSVQLQPHGVVNMKKIEELTMHKIALQSTNPVRRRRSLGVYLLAAALITLLMATTVFAYVGFTQYENPLQMLATFYGNEEMESIEGGKVFIDDEYKPYTVVQPTIERVPLDEELAEEVTPPIAAVGQTVSWGNDTLTIVAHQHDKNLGAGTIYYTVENPTGVEGYATQYDGNLYWPNGEIMFLKGCTWENYIIPSETTDTRLSIACYYHGTERTEERRKQDNIEMCFYNTNKTIQLSKYASETETIALMSENGEILISSIGMDVRIQDMEFLQYDTILDAEGDECPLVNEADINYVAVRFADGSEYVVHKDKGDELISNCADVSIYQQDYTFGDTITYMFNRIIDPNLITAVVINETAYPVKIVADVSVRMEMLPKTKVFNWEEYQEKMPVVEITS